MEFQWTDELVEEFSRSTEDVASFKKRKSNGRTVVFKTDDGVDVYPGDEVWYVTLDTLAVGSYRIQKLSSKVLKNKYFYKEENAIEYMTMNKPVIRVVDVMNIASGIKGKEHFHLQQLEEKLLELVKSIINK